MILWNDLKLRDFIRLMVMVLVLLVVMQMMIISQDIVSLVKSTEFWKAMSWSAGLVLVPLINSSKQKMVFRAYHDMEYGTDVQGNTPDSVQIGIDDIKLDGWITTARYRIVNDNEFNDNTIVYGVIYPEFNPANMPVSDNSGTPTNSQLGYNILDSLVDQTDEITQIYSDIRPYVFRINGNNYENGGHKTAKVQINKWVQAGTIINHVSYAQAVGSITTGSYKVFAEYTFVIANYNSKKSNPNNSHLFWICAGNVTVSSNYSIQFPTGIRLTAMESLLFSDYRGTTKVSFGKELRSVNDYSADSVNDFTTHWQQPDIIELYNPASEYVGTIDSVPNQADYIRHFNKSTMYFHKGEGFTFKFEDISVTTPFLITAYAMPNYQDKGQLNYAFSTTSTGDVEFNLSNDWDQFIDHLEVDYYVQDGAGQFGHKDLSIYHIKNSQFYVTSNTANAMSTTYNASLDMNNKIGNVKLAVSYDGRIDKGSELVPVSDYSPQGSVFRFFIDNHTFEQVHIQVKVHYRNARKISVKNALQVWRDENIIYDISRGVMSI